MLSLVKYIVTKLKKIIKHESALWQLMLAKQRKQLLSTTIKS